VTNSDQTELDNDVTRKMMTTAVVVVVVVVVVMINDTQFLALCE
jgi:hypothetical protein